MTEEQQRYEVFRNKLLEELPALLAELVRRAGAAVFTPGGNTGSGYTPAPNSPYYEPAGAVAVHEAKADPHPQYLTTAEGNDLYTVPDPPDTIAYLTDSDGAYITDADGRYLYEAA